jgi:hypothetical protein
MSADTDVLPQAINGADNLAGPVHSELDPDSELAELIFGDEASQESAD